MSVSSSNSTEPNGVWIPTPDGAQQFLRLFPAKRSTASLLYLHGIEGHSLWFAETANFLADNGVSVLALDRRGSGMSKEPRGDMTDWRQLLSDTSQALQYTVKQAVGTPVFLILANCWSAKLAALLAEKQRPEARLISGLILSSPAINVKVDLPFLQKLEVAWRFALGDRSLLPIPLEVADFTNNPVYLQFIKDDSLRLTEASARFFVNTFILTLLSKGSAEKIEAATLLLQSGTDSIVDVSGVKRWFARLGTSDKRMEVFEGVHHSLDFDKQPERYRQMLLNFILEHCKTTVPNAEKVTP